MCLTPCAPLRIAVLAHLPFAIAVELHARAIDNQMNRFPPSTSRAISPAAPVRGDSTSCPTGTSFGRNLALTGLRWQARTTLHKALSGKKRQVVDVLGREQRLNRLVRIDLRLASLRRHCCAPTREALSWIHMVAYSTANRAQIPGSLERRFHGKPSMDSTHARARIPRLPEHELHVKSSAGM
jgi:hypothetical protein